MESGWGSKRCPLRVLKGRTVIHYDRKKCCGTGALLPLLRLVTNKLAWLSLNVWRLGYEHVTTMLVLINIYQTMVWYFRNWKRSVVLRTMSNAELADRIPSPISRGCDLPMVSFLPHLEELRFGGNVGFVNRRGEIFPRCIIVCISPVNRGYIRQTQLVWGTDSLDSPRND